MTKKIIILCPKYRRLIPQKGIFSTVGDQMKKE